MNRNGMYIVDGSALKLLASIAVVFALSVTSVNGNKTVNANGCNITWDSTPGASNNNGIQVHNISTPEACQDHCASQLLCFSVDFDTSPTSWFGCWIHEQESDLKDLYKGDNVTNYRMIRSGCPSGCIITWNTMPSTRFYKGRQVDNYTTVASCKNYCASLDACVGIEFDTSPYDYFGCWVHTDQSDLGEAFVADKNITHYRIKRTSCPSTTQGPTRPTVVAAAGYETTLSPSTANVLISSWKTEIFVIISVISTSWTAMFWQH